MSQARYIISRSIQTVFILLFILTFLFFFFRMMPGNYIDLMFFGGADEEAIQAFKDRWALDEPLYIQYWIYLQNFVQGDMGTSLQYREPVVQFVWPRIVNTFILVAPGITVAYLLSIVVGTILGSERGSKTERTGVIFLITIGAFPTFFTGIVLILIFAAWLNWFPTSGMVSPDIATQYADASWWRVYFTRDFAWHYILPFSVIVLRYMYEPAIIMRTSVVEVAGQGFSYFHRIRGLPYVNRLKHLGKHAILPVLTLYPISMAKAISGLVLIEFVFNWPGIGFTLIEAVLARDTPVVQFVFFLTAAFVVIANFVVDILYGVIDPRVSLSDN